jgi:hypothetical protein
MGIEFVLHGEILGNLKWLSSLPMLFNLLDRYPDLGLSENKSTLKLIEKKINPIPV